MSVAMNIVFVLLACSAATNAVPAHFPLGKTVTYNFHTDVRAGTIESTPYISQFELKGKLVVRRDTSIPSFKNAFHVVLTDVKTGMHNGKSMDYEHEKDLIPINDDAKAIEESFLIVYDDESRLNGVKMPTNERGWSRNMKIAIASMFQLDMANMKPEEPTKERSFMSEEYNIHGNCRVSYDVAARDPEHPLKMKVTKFYSPDRCSQYAVHKFDHVDKEQCEVEPEEQADTASRKYYELVQQGKENVLIEKIVAHGTVNYFPWNARSEAHYVMTNTTLIRDEILPNEDYNLRQVDFMDMRLYDLGYQNPNGNYAVDAAIDVTQGRHVVNREITVTKLKKMLGEAADYLEEIHLVMEKPDWKHGQTVNRILQTMSYMDLGSLEEVFSTYQDSKMPKDDMIKHIFLEMVTKVGTKATCLFTLNIIRKGKIGSLTAVKMLEKLPMNVRVPTTEMLTDMEGLLELSNAKEMKIVREAGILCFATLIQRTYESAPRLETYTLIVDYVNKLFNRLKDEPEYEMKVVYMMALKNIRIVEVRKLLAPIISGEIMISESPERIRLLAIWAIEKSMEDNYSITYNLLWPVMANKILPVKLRIAAYDILMNSAPTMTDVLRIYWFMVEETNEHLYNYHYTTIKGIANSVDPCKVMLRDNVRKIIRFTRIHAKVPYPLAEAYLIDYKDEMYNHAEKLDTGVIRNEATGLPEVFHLKHTVTEGRKPVGSKSVLVHVEGCDEMMTLLVHGQAVSIEHLYNDKVIEVIRRAANDSRISKKKILIDIIVMDKGRVTRVMHFNKEELQKIMESVTFITLAEAFMMWAGLTSEMKAVTEDVSYDHLYEMHVISDMGIPILLENRVPVLQSTKYRTKTGPHRIDFEIERKIWRHGDYSMSIYNPISDVWHAIRRSTATDVTIPINLSIDFDVKAKHVKMSFPILSHSNSTVTGFRTHAKNSVTVTGDNVELLKASCSMCHHHEDVSLSDSHKHDSQTSIDLMDTGLRYTMATFDCDNGFTSDARMVEFFRTVFLSDRKNDWNDVTVSALMGTRQYTKNLLISPRVGSCGTLVAIEPSIDHPTNRIDLKMRLSYEDMDHKNPTLHLYPSEKWNVRGTMDVISAITNTSTLTWDLNVNVDLNQGHLMNTAMVQLTRKTPDEENLKICLDGQIKYSPMPTDPLKVGVTNDETNMKLTMSVGRTNEDKCMRDDVLISMSAKGILSDQTKKEFIKESMTSACGKDKTNPLYANPKNIVPKTLNCLNEAIKYTTLRTYIVNLAHKKIPTSVIGSIPKYEDVRSYNFVPEIKYTVEQSGTENIKFTVNYPMQKNKLTGPLTSFDSTDSNVIDTLFNGLGTIEEPDWDLGMDNARFSISALNAYHNNELKMCSIYPKIVLTADGGNVPVDLPSDKWTLISGDIAKESFAVFAKMDGPNMAVKIYVIQQIVEEKIPGQRSIEQSDREIEILPSPDNSVRVKIDGQDVSSLEKGVLFPHGDDDPIFKVTKNGEHIYVQLYDVPLLIVHGINHVALGIESKLQGRVSGLCGHLDGTYIKKIPQLYTMSTDSRAEMAV